MFHIRRKKTWDPRLSQLGNVAVIDNDTVSAFPNVFGQLLGQGDRAVLLPPVQPIAMTSWLFPSLQYRGIR